MATADWPEDWPEDWPSESPSKREEDEEEDESYSLTHDTESRTPENKEAPEHAEMPELENIPSVEINSLQRSVASFSPPPAQEQIQRLDVPDILVDQHGVQYSVYESEEQLSDIIQLMKADLSEPYSVYTYRYFIHQWPHLCMLAHSEKKCVGAIVCKLDKHRGAVQRGYIAMLAVDKDFRKKKIGSNLVKKAISQMIRSKEGCDEVVLEAEVTNKAALGLYANLGFVRDKYLHRYYLNGADAYRLKLWLTEKSLQY